MLHLALFDLDGTLVDTVQGHAQAWHEALASYGVEIPVAVLHQHIGQGSDQLLPVVLPEDQRRRFGAEVDALQHRIYVERYLPRARAFPQAHALVAACAAEGLACAIATSAKDDEREAYLDLLDLRQVLAYVTGASDVAHSKPRPDVVQVALAAFPHLLPAQAVMIGDSPYDCEAARTAGTHAWGVRCGGYRDTVLLASGAEQLFDGPAHLLRQLDRLILQPA